MARSASSDNVRADPDKVLVDIADYDLNYRIATDGAFDTARLCVTDSLACALDALDIPACANLLGPLVPGTVVPNGSRVPGTRYELDPVTAAFNFGAMIRWSDLNDAFTAACGGHPSDNLGGILMLADHLSRSRVAAASKPLLMRDVLEALAKAYEIQGCIAIENDFFHQGSDHNLLIRVATTAVLTQMLGGTREQIINAVSNAWIDTSLVAYRYAPNTGSRKNWACGDASSQAVRLAMMALKGEKGYPSILTAKRYGFYDARFGGKPFGLPQPYAEYVIQNSMFKFVTAGMHSQSAVECAFRLHPLVKDRIGDIERVELHGHAPLIDIMGKTGPLYNADDRDHCVQYVVAVGLIHGKLGPHELEDDFAADPRIDELRAKMVLNEDPRYTKDFYDPAKRSSANAVQVWFKDGSSTAKMEEDYPIGHQRRRTEAMPVLRAKFEAALGRRFSAQQRDRILKACDGGAQLDRMPVHEFVGMFVPAA
jgi:2-methylcitrate dehydratase